jgi:peptidoglycan/xylan/chitin deacetylase (PgdA/CDA1 family)
MIGSLPAQPDDWVCLVYHDVQPALPPSGGGPDRFSVSVSAFDCVLDTIAQSGYRGCALADAFAVAGRRVAITFDDGTRGQFDYAFPALLARGMTATFYVTTDWVGRRGYMTWEELRELVASGMSVQSHTRSHPFLSELGAERLREELGVSKSVLDDNLGQDTHEIAFPGGDAPAKPLRHVLSEAGYRVAVGTRWGVNRGTSKEQTLRAFVRRCTVRRETTSSAALRIIEGDPWLDARYRLKESALRGIRSALGASRYARWRRLILDSVRAS